MAKKYYVVWNGRRTGIFDNWPECKRSVEGFSNAKFKSFNTIYQAEKAYGKTITSANTERLEYSKPVVIKKSIKKKKISSKIKNNRKIIKESISVDGARNKQRVIEWQAVDTKTGKVLFREGPLPRGSNNIAEFLAVVQALAYCKINDIDKPIYTDSRTAIAWVRDKSINTSIKKTSKNEQLFDMIYKAVDWLRSNKYNNKILKWNTKEWGEIPADFGRK